MGRSYCQTGWEMGWFGSKLKWIDGGNYELCIEDVRDEIWDMVKPADLLRITLSDLLSCKQGGTVASMLIDVRGFWAHNNRENLLQEEEEPEVV
ncbi:probable serine/threonine-protein phosphatase 2A regulatory subunit B'' subunit TON2 [Tanacetum coccineum]